MKTHPIRLFLSILFATIVLNIGSNHAFSATPLLMPGDIVKITVYGHSDLSTEVSIAENGAIKFPLLGEVYIGELTALQAENVIANSLGDGGFVKNASVNIFIEQRSESLGGSVTVLGQVTRSGQYSLRINSGTGVLSLIDLLATAGGISNDSADHLFIVRQQGDKQQKIRVDLVQLLRNGDIEANLLLSDNDIILVPEMDVFYVYGEVHRPGRYRLERNMTVMQALSVASGVTDQGSEKSVILNRRGNDGLKSQSSELSDELQPDDVIYVKSSFF
ncbi:MAG: polysaccharide export protein EpsE [Gammaproteobacteria bacterium]|nr:polysaccharide export protein EpsE [Gammaproteobacteria bacterium]MCP4090208.1 polysaccharide export protein EpsE [Gammaproteobacteria bacterium]MCP4831891.1 polysaccharide export protein EpsE [Gammaproteobacteria bacterium]MCP4928646.1 polysaccharide export protein EpsE [Gammaproteobacteria bacterium]